MKLTLGLPEKKEQSKQEHKEYCAAIFAVFPRLEKDIREEMYAQLVSIYSVGIATSKTKEERDFEIVRGNGILEGMAILLDKWEKAQAEHQDKPDTNFDKNNPIAEI